MATMSDWGCSECVICGHVIDWDDQLGWFHDAHRVFDHDAVAELPAMLDNDGDVCAWCGRPGPHHPYATCPSDNDGLAADGTMEP